MEAARRLQVAKSEVISAWENNVRAQILAAAELNYPTIIDTLPAFLDKLIEALSENHPRELATNSNDIAREHGGERARLTKYGPESLIKEYQILRDVMLEKLESWRSLTDRERNVVVKSIDQAVQESMMAYFLIHSKLREQFVMTLSHDLRNPLGAAKMATEIILSETSQISEPGVRADIAGMAERAANNIKRVDRLIQNLLDTSTVQFGEKLPLNFARCDFLTIIQEMISEMTEADQERIRIIGGSVKGYWDHEGLRRALENLIANAVKYGSPLTPITIRITMEHQRAIVSVHNEGAAIPAEDQENLFQPFVRSHQAKAGAKKGWGIGLALVRAVAEGHGGSVAIDSSPDTGTTFVVDIPTDSRPFKNAATTESSDVPF